MYDVLRAAYRFHCPRRPDGERTRVALSSFRRVVRLPGAAHPSVFQIDYDCPCGDRHVGLVSHDDLDYGPLHPVEVEFKNLLTGRTEPVGDELAELARSQVQRGNWPWQLYCSPEARMRPVWPSSLALVAPAQDGRDDVLGVAMSCPACGEMSLNLVSGAHLDVPFYHDRVVRYVDRPFGDGRDLTVDRFHHQLHSARFDAERADLA